MQRLAKFDVSASIPGNVQKRAAEAAFGAACALLFVIVRTAVDGLLPGAGPFALIYPVVMVATLYGHLTGGITAFVASFLWAWYFVLPLPHSFALANTEDAGRLIVNAAAALVIVIFSEAFRRAIATALGRLEAEVAFSNMLQGEL